MPLDPIKDNLSRFSPLEQSAADPTKVTSTATEKAPALEDKTKSKEPLIQKIKNCAKNAFEKIKKCFIKCIAKIKELVAKIFGPKKIKLVPVPDYIAPIDPSETSPKNTDKPAALPESGAAPNSGTSLPQPNSSPVIPAIPPVILQAPSLNLPASGPTLKAARPLIFISGQESEKRRAQAETALELSTITSINKENEKKARMELLNLKNQDLARTLADSELYAPPEKTGYSLYNKTFATSRIIKSENSSEPDLALFYSENENQETFVRLLQKNKGGKWVVSPHTDSKEQIEIVTQLSDHLQKIEQINVNDNERKQLLDNFKQKGMEKNIVNENFNDEIKFLLLHEGKYNDLKTQVPFINSKLNDKKKNIPDFKSVKKIEKIEHGQDSDSLLIILGTVHVEVFESSLDGKNYRWYIASNSANQVWIEKIVPASEEISSYGTFKYNLDTGFLTTRPNKENNKFLKQITVIEKYKRTTNFPTKEGGKEFKSWQETRTIPTTKMEGPAAQALMPASTKRTEPRDPTKGRFFFKNLFN